MMTAAGAVPGGMGPFLTPVERSIAHFPGDHFHRLVSRRIAKSTQNSTGLAANRFPARIAALIQSSAERMQPLLCRWRKRCLRLLDMLVIWGPARKRLQRANF